MLPNGGNEWHERVDARQTYLVPKMSLPEITKVIEDLLVRPPRHRAK